MAVNITYTTGDISDLKTKLEEHIDQTEDSITFTKKIVLRFEGKAGIISEIAKDTTFTKEMIEESYEQVRDYLPSETAGGLPRPGSGFNEGANGSPGPGTNGSPGPGAPMSRAGSAGSPVGIMLSDAELVGRDVILALAYIFKIVAVGEPEGGGRRQRRGRRVTRRQKAAKIRR